MVTGGELRLGDAARLLRKGVLGMDRQTFAKVVKLSPRAIAKLEDDADGNPTLDTLAKVFAPFGGRLSLVFPSLEHPPSLGPDRLERRQAIRDVLAKSRRRRGRAPGSTSPH